MSSLEAAWTRAQPKLSGLSNIVRSIPPRIVRVSQLDAELLDQELVQLLQEPLYKALSLLHVSLKAQYEHELWLFVQLVLYKLSIWDTGASYGSKLQDLRYIVSLPSRARLTPSGMPRRTLLLHGLLTVLIPYAHARIRTHALSRAWPDAPSSDTRRKAWSVLTSLESTHAFLALANFVAFLWNGRHRTLADRLLGMRLAPSRRLIKRDISYEFMNRQMVWHAFTEFLIFLLPLVNARGVRRRFYRLLLSTDTMFRSLMPNAIRMEYDAASVPRQSNLDLPSKRGKYWSLPRDQCAICAEKSSFSFNPTEPVDAFSSFTTAQPPPSPVSDDQLDFGPPPHPINTPYTASCGDIYCYHCIAERMMHATEDGDARWECLRCGQLVTSAERLSVDVEENESSDYNFTDEELESIDLSGSVGSNFYSESDQEMRT